MGMNKTVLGRFHWLRVAPPLTLFLLLTPIVAGLVGTLLPAFGYLPAAGARTLTLAPWAMLFSEPGLWKSLGLTLFTGFISTLLSLLLALGIIATCHSTRWMERVRRVLAPLLAVPHAAIALGLTFLIAPSGWLIRWISPWATGWERPVDFITVQDPWGLSLILALVLKETPYLLFMILAGLSQLKTDATLTVARSLGYGPVTAWLKTILPQLYPLIRLPVFAVLAFSLSVVDVALILGPSTPPPLAVLVLRWFNHPDLAWRLPAAAGATLLTLLTLLSILGWETVTRLLGRLSHGWFANGHRGGDGGLPRGVSLSLGGVFLALAGLSIFGMAIWSFARRWSYPDVLPSRWTLDNWQRHAGELSEILLTTLSVGMAAALIAALLTLACLENESRYGRRVSNRGLWLLYLPLLTPQVGFLFGVQVLLVWIGLDGRWLALVWVHLLFVLPYVFLSSADFYRAYDTRYEHTARTLGASRMRTYWRIKLPMLMQPILVALAVGFAVSVAQYLPTLFAGAGRYPTVTTEAVALASGANRRIIGVYATLQALLPLLFFLLALKWGRRKRGKDGNY